jgi:hypothetical protein
MDTAQRTTLIARYADGCRVVTEALADITDAEIDAREGPGEWSPRQIVHHLADSETIGATRLRRLLAEDDPLIPAFDQEEYARRAHYDLPIEPALALFRAVRAANLPILRQLSDAEWQRAGTHSESGHYTAVDWLEIYVAHAITHADQIRRARAAGARAPGDAAPDAS